MALADGVSFVAASSGTGTFVYGSARPSFLTPAQAQSAGELTDGELVSYLAQNSATAPTQREWGRGTYSVSGNSIARTTVLGTVNVGTPGTGSPLNFNVAPIVSLTLLAEDIAFIPATSNVVLYVNGSTGSNSNPGTSGAPFATNQHALNVAAQYDYKFLYTWTINTANDTYSEQIVIPAFVNLPEAGGFLIGNTTTPSSVVISDIGTNYAVTLNTGANVTMDGFKISGTYGGIFISGGANINLFDYIIDGTFANEMINNAGGAIGGFSLLGGTLGLTIGGSALDFVFSRGTCFIDNSTITILSGTTTSSWFWAHDATTANTYMDGGHIIGAANLTTSTGGLLMTNNAFFEAFTNTLVDGVIMTRANFPGNSVDTWIDFTSIFMGDYIYTAFPADFQALKGVRASVLKNYTFFVNASTGSDSNNGLSSGSAFATLQHAWDFLSTTLDGNGFTLTIDVAAGTSYTLASANPFVGFTDITINGAGSSSTTLVAVNLTYAAMSANMHFTQLTLTDDGTLHACINYGNGYTDFGSDGNNVTFKPLNSSTVCILPSNQGLVQLLGEITIDGSNGAFTSFLSLAGGLASAQLVPFVGWSLLSTPSPTDGWFAADAAASIITDFVNAKSGASGGATAVLTNGGVYESGGFGSLQPGSGFTGSDTTGIVDGAFVLGISVTITTAKLTPVTGTNGSMTFTSGVLTAQTPAT